MGIRVDAAALSAEISHTNSRLQAQASRTQSCVRTVNAYCSERRLTGAAYENSRQYFSTTHLPVLQRMNATIGNIISVNNSIMPAFQSFVPDTQGFGADTDAIGAEIARRQSQNEQYRRMIVRYTTMSRMSRIATPGLQAIIRMYEQLMEQNSQIIQFLQSIKDGLFAFDRFCSGLYVLESADMQQLMDMSGQMDEDLWKLSSCRFDIKKIQEALKNFQAKKLWDANGNLIEAEFDRLMSLDDKTATGFDKLELQSLLSNPVAASLSYSDTVDLLYKQLEKVPYAKATESDKIMFVKMYEDRNPKHGDAMDALFHNIPNDTINHSYSDDVRNIKYIAYTAEPLYKDVFFKYANQIRIGDYNSDDGCYYKYKDNKIYVDLINVGKNDPRGDYVIFFHECAHAIDDFASQDGVIIKNFQTVEYRNAAGVSLQEIIEEDVRTHIGSTIDIVANKRGIVLSDTQKRTILSAIIGSRQVDTFYSIDLDEVYHGTIEAYGYREVILDGTGYHYNEHIGTEYIINDEEHEAIADIFGGMTNNTLGIGYMHYPNESEIYNAKAYTYWYDIFGRSTKAQSKEFFAEYFSYGMTQNPLGQQNAVNDYFNNAGKFVEEMLMGMGQ